MINTNYNQFTYGAYSYKPGSVGSQQAEEAKLRNLPWNKDAKAGEKLTAVPGAKEDDEKNGKGVKIKGHYDDPSCECETCKRRKYQDGSDEMVSFKSAQSIAPAAVATRVRAHEQEHVSNAYKKAEQKNGKVLQASVTLHTAICPECGRTYISGGETRTQIKYYNEDNPYQKDLKSADRSKYVGMNADFAV